MKKNTIIKSVSIVMLFGLLSKAMGFLREMLMANTYGASPDTDAYFLANSIVSLFGMITVPITNSVIPMLSKIGLQDGKYRKNQFCSHLISTIVLLTAFMVALGIWLCPLLIQLLASDFSQHQMDMTTNIVRIGLPSIIISAVVGISCGYLQSENNFLTPASSDIALNTVYILFLLFAANFVPIYGMMVCVVIATMLRMVIQFVALRRYQFHYKFSLDFRDRAVHTTLLNALPALVSVAVNDLNQLIDKSFASGLDTGTISALNYATKTNNAVMTIFITSMVTVLFPNLSLAYAKDDKKQLRKTITSSMQAIILLTIPVSAGIIILAQPIVKVAFEHGVFDSSSTIITAESLALYSVGLLGISMRALLERVFYSMQDMRAPMINAILAVLINVVLNIFLITPLQHKGLALATSTSSFMASAGLLMLLHRKSKVISWRTVMRSMLNCIVAALIMVPFAWLGNWMIAMYATTRILMCATIGLTGIVCIVVYAVALRLMKEELILSIFHKIQSFRRRRS